MVEEQATGNGSRRTIGGALGVAAAALLFAASIIQPEAVNADDGGGFHHRFGHFHGGFGIGAIYAPFWWGYAYYGYYGDYPDHRDYGYDPGSSV
jgi:hypothetical protein